MNTPKEIKDKITEEAKEFCRKPLNPDVVISHKEYSLAGLMAYHHAAEKYYLLGQAELKEKEAEIGKLKGLIERAFEAGEKYEQDRHKPSFTGFLDGYTGIYGFKKFAKENNL